MRRAAVIILAAAVSTAVAQQPPVSPPRVAVLSIDLNNLTNSEPGPSLPARLPILARAMRAALAGPCGYAVVEIDPVAERGAHATQGYYYAHPDLAAALATSAGADWVIVPRVNRASPWVADLQAHVVRVNDTMLVSNRIVELKGLELDSALATRLTERGAAWMADQVSQAIEHATHPGATPGRRCPP